MKNRIRFERLGDTRSFQGCIGFYEVSLCGVDQVGAKWTRLEHDAVLYREDWVLRELPHHVQQEFVVAATYWIPGGCSKLSAAAREQDPEGLRFFEEHDRKIV
jgi:hypothetical protein